VTTHEETSASVTTHQETSVSVTTHQETNASAVAVENTVEVKKEQIEEWDLKREILRIIK
jgi:hypothetical protein